LLRQAGTTALGLRARDGLDGVNHDGIEKGDETRSRVAPAKEQIAA
jgi:hypothetical protein